MFNNYTKFTTAFATFALLFSTGALSQCDPGLMAVDYTVGGGSWDSEISWSLTNAAGEIVASGGAPITGSVCLPEGDYTFIGLDAYGDGWNGATATFTNGVNLIGFFMLTQGSIGSVDFVICPQYDVK